MESKNIKIVDEHGIDRTASVIFSIDVSGSDYIVYAIERDNENDNIFVSKLIKNIDNTSNLMNIEDSMEKENISNLVKQLTLDAVNSNNDVLDKNEVVLSDGKVVKFITSLINKEQSINVQKTYIATVKKSVTKVSTDYYNIKEDLKSEIVKNNDDVVESIFPVAETVENSESLNDNIQEPIEVVPMESSMVEQVQSIPEGPVLNEEVKVVEEIAPILPVSEPEVIIPDILPNVTLDENKVEEIKEEIHEIEPVSIVENSIVEPIVPEVSPIVDETPEIPETTSVVEEPKEILEEEIKPILPVVEPITPEVPKVKSEVIVPSLEEKKVEDNKLVFDASKESNLTDAFNEEGTKRAVLVENVEAIRDFGVDENLSAEKEKTLVRTRKAGFANNKFFMVIAITIFFGACVFLGYEAFRFFQLTK